MNLILVVCIWLPIADCPSPGHFIRFVVPAVQYAEVKHTVQPGFHAAGSAGFLATARIVQPQIDALHHFSSNFDAVVLDEYQPARYFRIAGKLKYFPDENLARMIARMGFSRKEDLNRHFRIEQDLLEAIHITE